MTRLPPLRHCLIALLAAACLLGAVAPAAQAEFGPIQLASKSSKEQAAFAREPAVSGDGRYVAFVGELGGRSGIFRKDLFTGAVTLVVEGSGEAHEVRAPSISSEGRFVSFTTKGSLEPVVDPEPETEDVYVADLSIAPPTYELASVESGHRMNGSSTAAPRVAMSANGSEVAFVNQGQVYVHRRGVEEPTLITVQRGTAEKAVQGGGAYQQAGAALSADGNAVAWVGENLPEQVLMAPQDEAFAREKTPYREPLWREVPFVAGSSPPARRIVGEFPGIAHGREWFSLVEGGIGFGWGTSLPQLSADGSAVATIGRPEEDSDLFVARMRLGSGDPGLVTALTKWINPDPAALRPELVVGKPQFEPFSGEIDECAISPDGERIAFTTQRQVFPLAPPTLITARPTALPAVDELYQIDLESRTIERVTPGPGASISAGPFGNEFNTASPSYSSDDRTLAFSSGAHNLVDGDGNDNNDVFTVESKPPTPVEPSRISPPPSSLSVVPAWRLSAHAVSRPNGAVRVIAAVPGAGSLDISAMSPVGSKLRFRQVDTVHRRPTLAGLVRLELKLPRKLRGLARRKGGLYTSLSLRFSGAGGRPLQNQLSARFRAHRKAAPKGKKP